METNQVPRPSAEELMFLRALLGVHPDAVGAVSAQLARALTASGSVDDTATIINKSLMSAFTLGALLAVRIANKASAELIKKILGTVPDAPKESMN